MMRVRTATFSDLEAMRDVSVRNGLSTFDPDEMRLWLQSHPFRAEFADVPFGWVLESAPDGIVGSHFNIPMMYELEGKRFRCVSGGSWGVDLAHRNASLLLGTTYFNQKGIDMLVSGSISEVAAKLMPVFRAKRIPSENYDLGYFWILRRQSFAAAALRKKKVPAAALLSYPAAVALWAEDLCNAGRRKNASRVRRLTQFGKEFDSFWEKLRQGPGRLRAVRTSAVLEWRFGTGIRQNSTVALGLFRSQEVLGYIVLRAKTREHLGLRQFLIADLQALEDSPEVLLELLSAALSVTREQNLDVLEWRGWNPAKRQLACMLRPKSYRYPVWPLYAKAFNPALASLLTCPEKWDFSPFDAF